MDLSVIIITAAILAMIVYSVFIYKNYQKMQNEMNKMVSQLTDVGNNLVTYNSAVERNLEKTREAFSECYANIQSTVNVMRKIKIDETIAFENRKDIINNAANTMNQTLTTTVNTFKDNIRQQLVITENLISVVETTIQQALDKTKVAVGKTDDTLQQVIEKMNEHTEIQLNEFKRLSITNKDIFLQKLNEFPILADELRNLTEIKSGIAAFESVIGEQNQRFDNLCAVLEQIAQNNEKKSEKSFVSKLIGN